MQLIQPEGHSLLGVSHFLASGERYPGKGRYVFLTEAWLAWIVEQILKFGPSFAPELFSELKFENFKSGLVVPPGLLTGIDPAVRKFLVLGGNDPSLVELIQHHSSSASYILGAAHVLTGAADQESLESLLRPRLSLEVLHTDRTGLEAERGLSSAALALLKQLQGTALRPTSIIKIRTHSGIKETILLDSHPTLALLSSRFSMVYRDKRIITADGVRYVPITLAAWVVQTSDRTLRRWIEKAVTFNNKAIQSYISPVTLELYLSQESVEDLERRFVKWPSQELAGPVTIGESTDRRGFLALPDVARLVGVSAPMMWEWANKGQIPSIRKSLDVIKCPISDQLYLREDDALEVAKIRRSGGLKRGRIPRTP
jgi:hypothetical protein